LNAVTSLLRCLTRKLRSTVKFLYSSKQISCRVWWSLTREVFCWMIWLWIAETITRRCVPWYPCNTLTHSPRN
jgi:hypothetical protein